MKKIFDLGLQPFADTFIKKSQLLKSEPIFPLICFLNSKNGLIHNSIKTDEKNRYNLYEYSYTSSNSNYSKKYWINYSRNIKQQFYLTKKSKILEIGSNDGFLIKQFKDKSKKLYGVDASNFMCNISKKKGIQSFNLIFNYKNSNLIKKKIGKLDVIIANNVINHSNDASNFVKGVKNLLNDDGFFVFEVPYWYYLVKHKKIDQIYHEHISYFTIKYAYNLLKENYLQIFKIEETPYHGGSIRVYSKPAKKLKLTKEVRKFIDRENKIKLFKSKTYLKLNSELKKRKLQFLKKILNYKNKNFKIVGIGAAAKANTFINFLGLNNEILDFITDASKYKIGKFTPLTRIPIYSDDKLRFVGKKICAIPLAWNLEKILEKKLLQVNKNIKFLRFYK